MRGAERNNLRLHPHLLHAGAGHMHNSAIPGNATNRLPRKREHGSKHHMDGAPDSEGDRGIRTVISETAARMSDTPDPNLANNTATVSLTVQ